MQEVEEILALATSLFDAKKTAIRANCRWLAEHGASPDFIIKVAEKRIQKAIEFNSENSEDSNSDADSISGESVASLDTHYSLRSEDGEDSEYNAKTEASDNCRKQYYELKNRIQGQAYACVDSLPFAIKTTINNYSVIDNWMTGDLKTMQSVRTIVASRFRNDPAKKTKTKTKEKIDAKTVDILTDIYAFQQEIFDDNNFLGKIVGESGSAEHVFDFALSFVQARS